jgi:hypothetical protein
MPRTSRISKSRKWAECFACVSRLAKIIPLPEERIWAEIREAVPGDAPTLAYSLGPGWIANSGPVFDPRFEFESFRMTEHAKKQARRGQLPALRRHPPGGARPIRRGPRFIWGVVGGSPPRYEVTATVYCPDCGQRQQLPDLAPAPRV